MGDARMIPDYVLAALSKPADFSEAFTIEVDRLKNLLIDRARLNFVENSGAMYNSGVRLDACLDVGLAPVELLSKSLRFDIAIIISSKGKFFNIQVNELVPSKVRKHSGGLMPNWTRLQPSDAPDVIRNAVDVCSRVLTLEGYCELSREILDEVVEGYFTEIDERPAMVCEILFGEAL